MLNSNSFKIGLAMSIKKIQLDEFEQLLATEVNGILVYGGLRRTSLSKYNEIDVGDEHRIPLKPFLAILHVELNRIKLKSCGI